MNDINIKLTKKETEFVTDGLVYLLLQAERELVELEKLKDEETRDHVCNHQVRKIRSLRELKAKF
jgi:hypothetical protein